MKLTIEGVPAVAEWASHASLQFTGVYVGDVLIGPTNIGERPIEILGAVIIVPNPGYKSSRLVLFALNGAPDGEWVVMEDYHRVRNVRPVAEMKVSVVMA